MFKFFLRFIILAFLSCNTFASSQIVAMVGNEIITKNNLDNRYKFFLIENPQMEIKSNKERKYILQNLLKSMIDEKILFQELEKENVKVSQEELNQGVSFLEKQQGIPAGQLFKTLGKKGLSKEYILSQIKRTILWDKFLTEVILPKVSVGAEEVYEVMAYDAPDKLQVDYILVSSRSKSDLARYAGVIRGCSDKSLKKVQNAQRKESSVDEINDPHIRKAVITSAQGHPSYIFDYDGKHGFIFICEKKASKDAQYADGILSKIKQQKVEKQAEYHLQNLSKSKYIEIKEFE